MTQANEVGVLLGIRGEVFPYLCFDQTGSTATIVSNGGGAVPAKTSSAPGSQWRKGEAVMLHKKSSTVSDPGQTQYAYVVSVVSSVAGKVQCTAEGSWRVNSKLGGGWVDAQLVDTDLCLDEPELYEAKDAAGKWWPVTLTSTSNAEGNYSADVEDSKHTKWPTVHASNIQMKPSLSCSELEPSQVKLAAAGLFEGKDKSGKWWPIQITERNGDGSPRTASSSGTAPSFKATVADASKTQWSTVLLSNVRLTIPMKLSSKVQLIYTLPGVRGAKDKKCSKKFERAAVEALKEQSHKATPAAAVDSARGGKASPGTRWKNICANPAGVAIRSEPNEASKVDRVVCERGDVSRIQSSNVMPGDEVYATECVPGDGTTQAYLKLAEPWKGLMGYVPLAINAESRFFDKVLAEKLSETDEEFQGSEDGSEDSSEDPTVEAVPFETKFHASCSEKMTVSDDGKSVTLSSFSTSLVQTAMEPQSGRWEMSFQRTGSSNQILIGIAIAGVRTTAYLGDSAGGYSLYASNGNVKINNSSLTAGSENCCSGYETSDTVTIKYDSDRSAVSFFVNNTMVHKRTDLPVGSYFFGAGGASGAACMIHSARRFKTTVAPPVDDAADACSPDCTINMQLAEVIGSAADGFRTRPCRSEEGVPIMVKAIASDLIPCAMDRGVQWVDTHGRTLLHYAVIGAAPACLLTRIVIKYPAALAVTDSGGSTPIKLAIAKRDGSGNLRAELQGLQLSALRKKALSCGVDPEVLDDADDSDDPKAAMIELVTESKGDTLDLLVNIQGAARLIQRAAMTMVRRQRITASASALLQALCRRRLAVWPAARTRSTKLASGPQPSEGTFDVALTVAAPAAASHRRSKMEQQLKDLGHGSSTYESEEEEEASPDPFVEEESTDPWVRSEGGQRPTVGDFVRLKVSKEGLSPGDVAVVSKDDKDANPYKLRRIGDTGDLSYFTEVMVEKVEQRKPADGSCICTLSKASSRLATAQAAFGENGKYSASPWESSGGKTARGHWLEIQLSVPGIVTGVQICQGQRDSYAPAVVEIDAGDGSNPQAKVGGGTMPTQTGWQDVPMSEHFHASVVRLYISPTGSDCRMHGWRLTVKKAASGAVDQDVKAEKEKVSRLKWELNRAAAHVSVTRCPRRRSAGHPAFAEIKRQRWAATVAQKYARRSIAPLAAERQVKRFANARRTGAQSAKSTARIQSIQGFEAAGQKLARRMGWDESMTRSHAELRLDLAQTVGLDAVKKYIDQFEADALGRHQVGEAVLLRHVLLSGEFGTGKRTAARLVGRCLGTCSGIAKDHWTAAQMTNPLVDLQELLCGPSKWREQISKDGTQVTSLDPAVKRRTVYYWRLEGDYQTKNRHVDSRIFAEISRLNSVLIIAGTTKELEGVSSIDCFRRQEPRRLDLPTLGLVQLAKISLQLVRDEGYTLDVGNALGTKKTSSALDAMKEIVRQKYDTALIQHVQRNAYLAADMLNLAKSRKNERVELSQQGPMAWLTPRMVLTCTDFGYDMVSKAELAEKLAAVEAAITGMVGWGAPAARRSAKHFFAEIRSRVEQAERDSTTLSGVLSHMVLTGNAGVGKRSFARLAHQALRAHGVLSKDHFVLCSAAELRGLLPSKAAAVVQKYFKQADGGCLLVDGADALLVDPSDKSVRALDSAREVLQALITEAEKCADSTLVVLSGMAKPMAGLLRSHPGLDSRFSRKVEIADFTSAEVAVLIEQQAASRRRALEPGLRQQLAKHIADRHGGGGVDDGNGRLARQLLEVAHGRMSERLAESWAKIEEIEDGAAAGEPEPEVRAPTPPSPAVSTPGTPTRPDGGLDRSFGSLKNGQNGSDDGSIGIAADSVDASVYIAADFGIGDALGATAEVQAEVDAAVAGMVGMSAVKEWFAGLKEMVFSVQKSGDLTDLRWNLNMILVGNPGTGKTTLARLLHQFYFAHGVLPKDNFVERNVLDLKGETVGGTAPKVKAFVNDAKGGTLFLDEAYALAESGSQFGGGDSFSKEAIRMLLTEVENNRSKMMVVLAGYKDKMDDFLRLDPGLNRRFPKSLVLPDYDAPELALICKGQASKMAGRELAPELLAEDKLAEHIRVYHAREVKEEGASLAIRLTEEAVQAQLKRLAAGYKAAAPAGCSKEDDAAALATLLAGKKLLTAEDFGVLDSPELGDKAMQAEVEAELAGMVGMPEVKETFTQMKALAQSVEAGGDPEVLQMALNLRLTGNPGTGKTTIAKLYARYLQAYGVLKRGDRFVELNALELKGQYVGHTTPTVKKAVADALGGCLFIDEAPALVEGGGGDLFSKEVVRTLLTEVWNHRTDLLVILAGYEDKMQVLMASDDGFSRRFQESLHLQDYTPAQVAEMAANLARKKGYRLGPELLTPGPARKAARQEELRGWLTGPAGLSAEAAAAVTAEGLDSLDDLQDLVADPAALDEIGALTPPERATLTEKAAGAVADAPAPPAGESSLAGLVEVRLSKLVGGKKGQNGGLSVALVERACAAASIRSGGDRSADRRLLRHADFAAAAMKLGGASRTKNRRRIVEIEPEEELVPEPEAAPRPETAADVVAWVSELGQPRPGW